MSCKDCRWRDSFGCPSRTYQACKAWQNDFERPVVVGKIKVIEEMMREELR